MHKAHMGQWTVWADIPDDMQYERKDAVAAGSTTCIQPC